MKSFPFGPAPLVILVVAIICGIYLAATPIAYTDADLTMWCFASSNYEAHESVRPAFEEKHSPKRVDIQLVAWEAVTSRLRAAFWADLYVPDIVEVEITVAGSFFRGPVEDIGFVDLTPLLKRDGLYDKVIKSRLSPYTNRGKIFGLPHDVHPVMLAYRRDLFEELGIDADKIQTWDDFIREGRRIAIRDKGKDNRFIINLERSQSQCIEMLLYQRGGGLFDIDGKLIMDNEIAVETVKWYVPLVAGPNRIAGSTDQFGPTFAKSVEDGFCLSFLCPDWKTQFTQRDVPRVAGKMALMPIPAVKPGGGRTSTWGGTMAGITKKSPNKELAWEFIKHLYLEPETQAKGFKDSSTIPAFKHLWSHPVYKGKHPYWSDQPIGQMYIDLAEQVPPQYGSPFLEFAKNKLGEVVAACVEKYESDGEDGFDDFVRRRLKQAGDTVRLQMSRNPF